MIQKTTENQGKLQKMAQKTKERDPKKPPIIQKTPQNIPKDVKIYQLKCNRKHLQKRPENLWILMKDLQILKKSSQNR